MSGQKFIRLTVFQAEDRIIRDRFLDGHGRQQRRGGDRLRRSAKRGMSLNNKGSEFADRDSVVGDVCRNNRGCETKNG